MTPLTENDWHRLLGTLDAGWPGEMTTQTADGYRMLLDGVPPDVILAGVRRLLHTGQKFRPTAAEILGAARIDPTQPTWDEAYVLIRHALRAPAVRPYEDYELAKRGAVRDRLAELHPLVAAFVEGQGIERLRQAPLDDPGADGVHSLRRLAEAWDAHVTAMEGREIVALASGDRSPEGLRRLDPLAGLKPATTRALPSGATNTDQEAA